jgi:hypothetical protein
MDTSLEVMTIHWEQREGLLTPAQANHELKLLEEAETDEES